MKTFAAAACALAVVVALGACTQDHEVQLILGPNADTLTIGFVCLQDGSQTAHLYDKTLVGGFVSFRVVVDLVTIKNRFPGCRGEELVQTCRQGGGCKVTTMRWCQDVTAPLADLPLDDPQALLRALDAKLRQSNPIAHDTPDVPVVVRAVTTTQSCAELAPTAPGFPAFDPPSLVGCAYSCPVLLDDVSGTLSLSLDAFDNHCAAAVANCAAFPAL